MKVTTRWLVVVTWFYYDAIMNIQGRSARRNADKNSANERSHVNVITIGANRPYGRRKRSNLNPSTSVRCEGIGKNFFLHFFEENEIFSVILFFLFCPIFWEDTSTSFWSYIFLCIFFFAFLVFVYVFSVII